MKCPYCESGTNDFVPMNQAVEYSGIEMAVNRQGMVGNANERIDRLEIIVETAITKAVHELIERLRYDDIQAIDEEEFAAAVRKLIFDADPGVQLPF